MNKYLGNKIAIVTLTILFIIPSLSPAQIITEQNEVDEIIGVNTANNDQDKPLIFIQQGPTQESTLYTDGSIIELQTWSVSRLIPSSDPPDMTLDDFKRMVLSDREAFKNDLNRFMVGDDVTRSGLNILFNVSSPPPGAQAALDTAAVYIESVFNDPITVTIDVGFSDMGPGFLGWAQSYMVGGISWTNTRNSLINGMDTDDTIQNWLPSGSTIPVRYSYPTGSPTNEGRCYFTKANYRATVGGVSGTAAHIEFNTFYSWDYDPSDGIPGSKYCFQSVTVHEVGHALGFTSGADFLDNNIEALDIYRFQRSDGSEDYNPDTLEEFQSTARLVWNDNDNGQNDYNDDVNSDLINNEYRMSDGNLYQASHFSLGNVDAVMQPGMGPGDTFYPDFYRQPDINMFDAIGWDYSTEPGTITLPFFDDFPNTIINRSKWTGIEGAEINIKGFNEPSTPFSLNLGGSSSGGNKIRTVRMNTSLLPEILLEYYYQRTGGGDSPEAGDDLVVEYCNSNQEWIEITRYPGSGPDMTTFDLATHALTASDALHENFRVQFSAISSDIGHDHWFIDDVSIQEVEYTLTILVVGNGSVIRNPNQPTYTYNTPVELTANADPGWSFSHWTGDDINGSASNPEIIIMDDDKTVTAHFTQINCKADFNQDDDVDLDDFASFAQCYAGAGRPPSPACPGDMFDEGFCKADFDQDGDVDLDDFAKFAQCYAGAGRPPAPACPVDMFS